MPAVPDVRHSVFLRFCPFSSCACAILHGLASAGIGSDARIQISDPGFSPEHPSSVGSWLFLFPYLWNFKWFITLTIGKTIQIHIIDNSLCSRQSICPFFIIIQFFRQTCHVWLNLLPQKLRRISELANFAYKFLLEIINTSKVFFVLRNTHINNQIH